MKNIKIKAVVSYILVTILLLTGCQSQQQEKVGMGRYIEQDIDVSAINMYTITQNVGGEIEAMGLSEDETHLIYYKLKEDNTWEETKNIEIQWPEDNNGVLGFDIDDKGFILTYASKEGNVKIYRILMDGTTYGVPLMESGKPYKMPEESWYRVLESQEGDWIIQEGWQAPLKSYDGKTGELKNTYCNEVQSMQIVEDKLYVTTGWQEHMLNVYDIHTGNTLESQTYPVSSDNNTIFADKEGTYLFNRNGIQYKSHQGKLWEEIVPASIGSFARQDMSVQQGFRQADGSFIVVFNGAEELEVKRYIYDETMPSKPSQEISVYMPYEVPTIQQAIAIYQKKYPDIYINITTPSQDISPQDAITSLNTELLAGGGPDLIILDGMPIETYIEKGLLVDLSNITDAYIKDKNGYENIIETFKVEDKVYAVPSRCRVPMLWGEEEVVSTAHSIHELAEYKKAHPDEVLFNKNILELYRQLYDICLNCWIDEDGNYSREKTKAFIKDLEVICEKKEDSQVYERIDFEMDKFPELLDVAEGISQVFVLEARQPHDIIGAEAVLDKRGGGAVTPFEIDGKGVYEVMGVMGINANSKYQDITKEIIQIALSDEVQGMINWLGMPLSENDLKLQEAQGLNYGENIISDTSGRRIDVKAEKGAYYEQCINTMKEVSLYCGDDDQMASMIYNAIRDYSENGKTLEEVLDNLDQQMELRNME